MSNTQRNSTRTRQPKPTAETLTIDGELNIYVVADLRRLLLARLETAKTFVADLSGVTEIDGAGLQLLIALDAEAARRGAALTWQKVSSAVAEALELCHLSAAFPRGHLTDEREPAAET